MSRRASYVACGMLLALALPAEAAQKPERGIASWYGNQFHGRPTASGEIMDQRKLTAAHRTLPLGTVVDVRNQRNGRTVRVKINDRGPFVDDRVIDLSAGAAAQLGMKRRGLAPVEIRPATWE
jgi:rare lipoprotein A